MKQGNWYKLLGSYKAILIEVAAFFSIASFEFVGSGDSHRMYAFGALLILSITIVGSFYLYFQRAEARSLRAAADLAVDDLGYRITSVLEHAIVYGWKSSDENQISSVERRNDVNEIWVLGTDLDHDFGCRRGTIIDNLKDGNKYRYICPHDEEIEGKLHNFLHVVKPVNAINENQLEMCCLHGRKLPPLQLLIFRPLGAVYLIMRSAPTGKRLLQIPEDSPLKRDIETGYDGLWSLLRSLGTLTHNDIKGGLFHSAGGSH